MERQDKSSKPRLFQLQTRGPHVSPVLNLAGRQDRSSERLSNKTPRQKKPKRETAGSQEPTKRPGNNSRLRDLAKRGGEHFVIGKAEREKGSGEGRETQRCCLTLTWSVKASCSFLATIQSQFYLLDSSTLSGARREPKTERKFREGSKAETGSRGETEEKPW